MKLLGDGYFTIIQVEEKYVELILNNTRQQWIIYKISVNSGKTVTLYHKYTANSRYYHKHWETWSVAKVVESIKRYDAHVIENGEFIGYIWERLKQKRRWRHMRLLWHQRESGELPSNVRECYRLGCKDYGLNNWDLSRERKSKWLVRKFCYYKKIEVNIRFNCKITLFAI